MRFEIGVTDIPLCMAASGRRAIGERCQIGSKQKKGRPPWEELRKEVPPKTFVESAECD